MFWIKIDFSHIYISIQLFISVCKHGIFFIHWIVVQYYFISFVAPNISVLAIEISFIWLLSLSDTTTSVSGFLFFVCFFEFLYFLNFWHYKMLQDYFVNFVPQFYNQPFFQRSLVFFFFLWENGIKNQDLSTRHLLRLFLLICYYLEDFLADRAGRYVCLY